MASSFPGAKMSNEIKCFRVDVYDTRESAFSREYFYDIEFALAYVDLVNATGYVEADEPVKTTISADNEWRIRCC